MILDEYTEFCDATSCANEAGTTLIGDVIDLGANPTTRDIGQGQTVYCVIQVTTAFDGGAGTAGVTTFLIASDAAAAIATDGTQTIHAQTDDFAAATQLTAGTTIVIPLPMGDTAGGSGYERYLGIQQLQATEGEDDGAINAFLTMDPHGWRAYPEGTN